MNKKMTYNAPEVELVGIQFEEHFLDGSVTGVRQSYGTAEEDTW